MKNFLNHTCSCIPEIYWISSGDTSNVAEACHSDANREGKHLKFLTAIFRYVLTLFRYFFNAHKKSGMFLIYLYIYYHHSSITLPLFLCHHVSFPYNYRYCTLHTPLYNYRYRFLHTGQLPTHFRLQLLPPLSLHSLPLP